MKSDVRSLPNAVFTIPGVWIMISVRKALETDCGAIMALIKELAEFERMPDQVQMTAERLRKDGFLENPKFECLVAEDDQVLH